MIDSEAIIKRFKRMHGFAWLVPEEPWLRPIPGNKATFLGKVVAVLRRF